MARLWRPGGQRTEVGLAASMIRMLSACHHRRPSHVVADTACHGRALRALPATVTFAHPSAQDRRPVRPRPPRTGRPGRPRLKGDRLGTAADLAARLAFQTTAMHRCQRRERVLIAELRCLW